MSVSLFIIKRIGATLTARQLATGLLSTRNEYAKEPSKRERDRHREKEEGDGKAIGSILGQLGPVWLSVFCVGALTAGLQLWSQLWLHLEPLLIHWANSNELQSEAGQPDTRTDGQTDGRTDRDSLSGVVSVSATVAAAAAVACNLLATQVAVAVGVAVEVGVEVEGAIAAASSAVFSLRFGSKKLICISNYKHIRIGWLWTS